MNENVIEINCNVERCASVSLRGVIISTLVGNKIHPANWKDQKYKITFWVREDTPYHKRGFLSFMEDVVEQLQELDPEDYDIYFKMLSR